MPFRKTEGVADLAAQLRLICKHTMSTKLVEATAAYTTFALEFAKRVKANHGNEAETVDIATVDTFMATNFKVEIVGEVAELTTSARLDYIFEQLWTFVGADFEINTSGKLKNQHAVVVMLSQAFLHLAQLVVLSGKAAQHLKAGLATPPDFFIKALQDAKNAAMFAELVTSIIRNISKHSEAASAITVPLRYAKALVCG